MSRRNREYVTKKGMISREFCNRSPEQLWSFNEKYLLQRENLIQPGGILTLRLSLFHADEYREQLPMYCTIEYPKQKEASRLPIVRDISTNTEAEPNTLLENLSEDFERFYDNTTIADCVLKVGNSQFQVHRAVLSARSTVFAAMFNHETKESLNGEIIIPDVDPVVLDHVLYYIYSGKIRGLTPDTAVSIYMVADKYALYKLRDVSLNFLLNRLTTENICDAAVLAHMHGEIKLEEKIICFVAERVEEFMESDKWKQFSQDKSLLANKLLCSALIMSKKKTIA